MVPGHFYRTRRAPGQPTDLGRGTLDLLDTQGRFLGLQKPMHGWGISPNRIRQVSKEVSARSIKVPLSRGWNVSKQQGWIRVQMGEEIGKTIVAAKFLFTHAGRC